MQAGRSRGTPEGVRRVSGGYPVGISGAFSAIWWALLEPWGLSTSAGESGNYRQYPDEPRGSGRSNIAKGGSSLWVIVRQPEATLAGFNALQRLAAPFSYRNSLIL